MRDLVLIGNFGNASYCFYLDFSGKFKDGIHNFSTELKPLQPEELLELLKSKDHDGVVEKVGCCCLNQVEFLCWLIIICNIACVQ